MQWYGAWDYFAMRIQQFVPSGYCAEIAPGFGRWTKYLLNLAERIVVVDLAEKCIEHCMERFASEKHIGSHVNNGRSLGMVEDFSLDFVFSYDSLVHAELDVMDAYIERYPKNSPMMGLRFCTIQILECTRIWPVT